MDLKEIKKYVELLEQSKLHSLHIKRGEEELFLEKEADLSSVSTPPLSQVKEKGKETSSPPEEEGELVTSPMVGTFYAAPAPDQPLFVKKGDRVTAESVVCIIEAMKLMNEVKAGFNGIIEEVLVENGQPVEFGTKLFQIK